MRLLSALRLKMLVLHGEEDGVWQEGLSQLLAVGSSIDNIIGKCSAADTVLLDSLAVVAAACKPFDGIESR